MKRWALVVVALYLLILVVLTVPVILLAFAPQISAKGISAKDIAEVVLVGGSTRIPLVKETVKKFFVDGRRSGES